MIKRILIIENTGHYPTNNQFYDIVTKLNELIEQINIQQTELQDLMERLDNLEIGIMK
jgi:hypothetical protein